MVGFFMCLFWIEIFHSPEKALRKLILLKFNWYLFICDFVRLRQPRHDEHVGLHSPTLMCWRVNSECCLLVPVVHDLTFCPKHPVIATMSGLSLSKSRLIPTLCGNGAVLDGESTCCMCRKLYFPLKTRWMILPVFHSTASDPVWRNISNLPKCSPQDLKDAFNKQHAVGD